MAPRGFGEVDSEDDVESKPFLQRTAKQSEIWSMWSFKKIIISNLITFILTSIIYAGIATIALRSSTKLSPPRTKTLSCGSSIAEARAAGCTYDVLSNLWVPTPCLDWETINEFKEKAPWQGYADRNATKLLTVDEMSEMTKDKGGYWTPAREHLVHCSLMWKRLHKAYLTDKRILDSNTARYEHTLHCSHSQVELGDALPEQLDQIVILTNAGFSTCEVEY